jgi:uncharacterized protein YjbI with pentapeptide repeats
MARRLPRSWENGLLEAMPPLLTTMKERALPIWKSAVVRCRHGWQWTMVRRRLASSVVGISVAVALLVIFAIGGGASWYDRHHAAIAPLLTLAAGVAVAGVALLRHFAQTDADRQRRITESYGKAVSQLASEKIEERLGGVYTLERISRESPGDHWTVMESLTAFVRERSLRIEAERTSQPFEQRVSRRAYFLWLESGQPEGTADNLWAEAVEQEKLGEPPPTDITAVLTVVVRRSEENREQERLNLWYLDFREAVLRKAKLTYAHLERGNFENAHLEGADLTGAQLEGTNLRGAHFEGANLTGAHLEGADLTRAHFEGANLTGAHFKDTDFTAVHFEGANLAGAHLEHASLFYGVPHLEGANLARAHLQGARLSFAHLERTNLIAAHLQDANLMGTYLNDADLTGAQLEGANLVRAHLEGVDLSATSGDTRTRISNNMPRPILWSPENLQVVSDLLLGEDIDAALGSMLESHARRKPREGNSEPHV